MKQDNMGKHKRVFGLAGCFAFCTDKGLVGARCGRAIPELADDAM